MTVPSTDKRTQYNGAGSTGPYTIGFPILDDEHIKVTRTVVSTGVDTVLTLNAGSDGYTVNSGLTQVTLTEALASGERLTIERDVPQTQLIDYIANSAFPAEVNEQGLDKLTMMVQQLQDGVDRSVKLASTQLTSITPLITEAPVDGAFITWDGTSGNIANKELADIDLTIDTVLTGLASGDFLKYDGTNWVNRTTAETKTDLGISAFGATLIDDADSTAARTTLGLGALSTLSTIGTSQITDNAVTLAKLEDGTQGDILYYGASGAPTRLGAGTAGQVLQTGGAGANPSWTDLAATYNTGEISANSGTAITRTGIQSESGITTVQELVIMFKDLSPSGTGNFTLQLGDSSGLTTTGYAGYYERRGVASANLSTNFLNYWAESGGTQSLHGHCVIRLMDASTFTYSVDWQLVKSDSVATGYSQCIGTVTLGGLLDRFELSITASNTFDGSGVISYQVRG